MNGQWSAIANLENNQIFKRFFGFKKVLTKRWLWQWLFENNSNRKKTSVKTPNSENKLRSWYTKNNNEEGESLTNNASWVHTAGMFPFVFFSFVFFFFCIYCCAHGCIGIGLNNLARSLPLFHHSSATSFQ